MIHQFKAEKDLLFRIVKKFSDDWSSGPWKEEIIKLEQLIEKTKTENMNFSANLDLMVAMLKTYGDYQQDFTQSIYGHCHVGGLKFCVSNLANKNLREIGDAVYSLLSEKNALEVEKWQNEDQKSKITENINHINNENTYEDVKNIFRKKEEKFFGYKMTGCDHCDNASWYSTVCPRHK